MPQLSEVNTELVLPFLLKLIRDVLLCCEEGLSLIHNSVDIHVEVRNVGISWCRMLFIETVHTIMIPPLYRL
jgi:hypothetical protein